jgi:hypothetical protein
MLHLLLYVSLMDDFGDGWDYNIRQRYLFVGRFVGGTIAEKDIIVYNDGNRIWFGNWWNYNHGGVQLIIKAENVKPLAESNAAEETKLEDKYIYIYI